MPPPAIPRTRTASVPPWPNSTRNSTRGSSPTPAPTRTSCASTPANCSMPFAPARWTTSTRRFSPNIFEIAKLSAGAAILAAEHALAGRPAFSLMRPPGHHAERNRVMGFCYFNNIAIAVAKDAQTSITRKSERVAILDFDCHHGNGTEDIFRGNERVLFVSLHQSPCYPVPGLMSAQLHQLSAATGYRTGKFLETLDEAMGRIRDFNRNCSRFRRGSTRTRTTRSRTWDWRSRRFTRSAGVADLTQPAPTHPYSPWFRRARRRLLPRIRPVRGRLPRRLGNAADPCSHAALSACDPQFPTGE